MRTARKNLSGKSKMPGLGVHHLKRATPRHSPQARDSIIYVLRKQRTGATVEPTVAVIAVVVIFRDAVEEVVSVLGCSLELSAKMFSKIDVSG